MRHRGLLVVFAALAFAGAACGSTGQTGAVTSQAPPTPSTTAEPTTATPATTATTATTVPPPTTVAGQATTVVADCGSGAYRPARIIVTCTSTGMVATQIQWSSWSTSGASGTSVVEVNPCQPTCAASGDKPYNARLDLSGRVSTSSGPRFSRLTLTWIGTPPFGQPSNSYQLPTTEP